MVIKIPEIKLNMLIISIVTLADPTSFQSTKLIRLPILTPIANPIIFHLLIPVS